MIDFVKIDSGKKMPVESNKPVMVVIVAESSYPGEQIYRLTGGLIPHWFNCPYAKDFKKDGN